MAMQRQRRGRQDDRFLPRLRRRVWSAGECFTLSTVQEKAIRLNNGSVVPLSWASFHEHLTKLLWNAKKYAPRLALLGLRSSAPSLSLFAETVLPPSLYILFPLSPVSSSPFRSSWRSYALGRTSFKNDPLKPVRITCSPISRSYFLSFSSFVHENLFFHLVLHARFPRSKQNRATYAT